MRRNPYLKWILTTINQMFGSFAVIRSPVEVELLKFVLSRKFTTGYHIATVNDFNFNCDGDKTKL